MKASGRDVKDLIAKAADAGFTLANGYGKLKGETFRIGHMGDHTVERVDALLAALSDEQRAGVFALEARIAKLSAVRDEHAAEGAVRDPWTMLAHALFNLKEFRFLR